MNFAMMALWGVARSRMVQSVARHVLTGVGATLVVNGTIEAETWDAVQGGALAVLGLGWSFIDKRVPRS